MKVQALIKMLESLERVFGADVDVAIRTASVTLDGEKIGRIYCEELLPMLNAGRPTRQQKSADNKARRQKIWKMRSEGVSAKIIASKFNISAGRVYEIGRRVDREIARAERRKAETAV